MRNFATTTMYGLARLMHASKLSFRTPFLIEQVPSEENDSWVSKEFLGRDYEGNQMRVLFSSLKNIYDLDSDTMETSESEETSKIAVYGPLLVQDVPALFKETLLEELKEFLEQKPWKGEAHFALQFPLSMVGHPVFQEFLEQDPDIMIITDPLNQQRSSNERLDLIAKVMKRRPGDMAFVYGGFVRPWELPLLYYLGFDGFISSWPFFATSQGKTLLYEKYMMSASESLETWELSSEELLEHNKQIMRNVLRRVVFEMKHGNLRDYVEQITHLHTENASLLRRIDHHAELTWLIVHGVPVSSSSKVNCIGEESLMRPEVRAFQQRVLEHFVPPKQSLVVLLPCSARKPYFTSRSHQRFNQVIQKVSRKAGVNITSLIVTSPLGGVPQELDLVFPAANYDIPVTGDWSETELEVTSEFVAQLLQKYKESQNYFVAYSGEDYKELIMRSVSKAEVSLEAQAFVTRTTSPENLQKFERMLWDVLNQLKGKISAPVLKIKRYSEALKLKAMVDYQFGPGSGEALFEDFKGITIKGKYPRNLVVQKGRENLAVLNWATAKVTLSLRGAELIKDVSVKRLVFTGDAIDGSSIFPIGIKDMPRDLQPLDEVLIVNEKQELLGTGYCLVSRESLQEAKRGALVKVRKKVKKQTNGVK